MKTSQIKKFLPQPPHSIKLKFQNIKTQQSSLRITDKDAANINYVCKNIDNAINKGEQLSEQILILNSNLLRKLRRTVQQQQTNENSSKIKFRVVKSAKKTSPELFINKPGDSSSTQYNKSGIVFPAINFLQNKSQLIENKQNKIQPKSSTFTSNYTKTKIKKKVTEYKSSEGYQTGEVRVISNQQLVRKLRGQAKMLLNQIQNKNKQNEILNERIKLLEAQNTDLSKKIGQNNQDIKIDLKISLKCIQQEQKMQKQIQQNNDIKIPPINSEQLEQKNRVKMKYFQQLIQQLQNMIVFQNKQLQSYRQALVAGQANNKQKKNQRWNCY